jgi:predicted DNA-binding antitoxin AbrB/MazE fold protein
MPLTVEAIYENGVLKSVVPLPLKEHEKVRVTVESERSWVERTAGMMNFKGTREEAEYFAMSPDLDFPIDEDDV